MIPATMSLVRFFILNNCGTLKIISNYIIGFIKILWNCLMSDINAASYIMWRKNFLRCLIVGREEEHRHAQS